jgi:hypothetical protein
VTTFPTIFFLGALLVSFGGFMVMMYYVIRAIENRRPGLDLIDVPGWNPFNLFVAGHRTPVGVAYRRKAMYAAGVHILPLVILFVVMAIVVD